MARVRRGRFTDRDSAVFPSGESRATDHAPLRALVRTLEAGRAYYHSTMPDTRSPSPALPSTHWLKSNLAALGSAAVLTVYAAGWARTKAAADLLEEQSERRLPPRRPAARVAMGQVEGTPVARANEAAASPPPAEAPAPAPSGVAEKVAVMAAPANKSTTEETTTATRPAPQSPSTTAGPSAAVAQSPKQPTSPANVGATIAVSPSVTATPTAPSASASTAAAPSTTPPSTVATSTTPASTSAPAPAPAPAQPAAPAPTVVPGAPRELATDAQATTSAAKTAAAPAGPVTYKDGLYSGWGTSRHGDIEAYVEIKDGRIKSAFIGECLTQYSCSWISRLPGWVVEAQSPETDYISGATHSSNAFYYAIVNALKKAAK
jgi:uncharacterized protein with FMN-binding domain